MFYQHNIQLRTPEPLQACDAQEWYRTVKDFGPDNVPLTYEYNGCQVSMEYGTVDDAEMCHAYVVPLKRNITNDEASIIVAAWEVKFPGDFDIEVSNQYDVMKTGADAGEWENSIEYNIDSELKEEVINSMSKHTHNRWVDQMVSEGWRCGAYYSSKNKTHPALKSWDNLPESHRRAPQFEDVDIVNWIRNRKSL